MREKYLLYLALGVLTTYGFAATAVSVRNEGLEFPDGSVQVTAAATAPARSFYLSDAFMGNASAALSACDPGYHMASLFELLDVSNLRYNALLGQNRDDMGSGPPTSGGWVRTGFSSDNSDVPGHANCSLWTDTGGTQYGTLASLAGNWSQSIGSAFAPNGYLGPWEVHTSGCIGTPGTWCIED